MKGIRFSAAAAGIKNARLDVGLVLFDEPMNVVSLYTRNRVKAAHILYNRKREARPVRALLVNSGCANACTGRDGVTDLKRIAGVLARELEIDADEVLFASTGVIGRRLPADRIIAALPELKRGLGGKHVEQFARAIMTTDTFHKIVQDHVAGKDGYGMIGVAKGAGMISPLFATMLSFVFTDAVVAPEALRRFMPAMGRETFERITVDGDTSTNDTVMVFARSAGTPVADLDPFRTKLTGLLKDLALMVVRDGEGATRVVHITVKGAKKRDGAERIARKIANSPLVKTAFFGCDPNWGRIMCAAGDAGVAIQQGKVEIRIQDQLLVEKGMEVPFSEEAVKKLMDRKEVEVTIDLHDGRASWDIYTTDLTYDYVKINASYRT